MTEEANNRRQRLALFLSTRALGLCHAADVMLEEQNRVLARVGFRYRPDYLGHHDAFPIDPVQLPLQDGEIQLNCRGGAPAFIDDYLPDRWGRRILARIAAQRLHRRFDANSVIESLALMGDSQIGAISLVPVGSQPTLGIGVPMPRLAQAERLAQEIDDPGSAQRLAADNPDVAGLLYLANSGTGVGGARPKALLYDEKACYLAKFNRGNGDDFNNARVELACLHMARDAGLTVSKGRVAAGINGREVLLLQRFDMSSRHERHHLISVNGLLKNPTSQQDKGSLFRYNDVHEILQRYSATIIEDVSQLVTLMLYNSAINNTDDHERNVSLIHRGDGYRLAPAYDLVPSIVTGAYHAAGFDWQPDPPRPSEARQLGRVFGLSKGEVAAIADRVQQVVEHWSDYADAAGVNETDRTLVARHLRT